MSWSTWPAQQGSLLCSASPRRRLKPLCTLAEPARKGDLVELCGARTRWRRSGRSRTSAPAGTASSTSAASRSCCSAAQSGRPVRGKATIGPVERLASPGTLDHGDRHLLQPLEGGEPVAAGHGRPAGDGSLRLPRRCASRPPWCRGSSRAGTARPEASRPLGLRRRLRARHQTIPTSTSAPPLATTGERTGRARRRPAGGDAAIDQIVSPGSTT